MRALGAGVLLLATTGLLWAQALQAPPVFRTGTDLVTVDALVTDDHGAPVTGLTADDFRITEKGRPQKIDAFTFITVPPIARAQEDPVPVAPIRDVVTNQVVPHSRAFAIVVDDMHLVVFHGERIRRVLTDLLGAIPTTDRVAVVFTGRSDLSVDLTDDRAAQLQAVGRLRDALGFALDPTPVTCGAQELQRKHQALGALDVLRNVTRVLSHTRADVRTVIYLSEGFNYDFSAMPDGQAAIKAARSLLPTCSPNGSSSASVSNSALPGNPQENPADAGLVRQTLQEILDTATRDNVRVYTIDPRGNLPAEDDFFGWVRWTPALQSKVTVENDFLRTVAADTGGLAAVQRSDLHGAVREFLLDTGSYYLLGYTPDPLVRDGLYHDVEVKVLRPGLHIRARKGYTAPEANPTPLSTARALAVDLAGGDATGDLALAAFVAPVGPVGKLTRTAVTIEVTYPGNPTAPASIADDLQYEIVDGDVEGKGKVLSTHAYQFSMTPTRPGDVPFLINDVIDVAPGVANLRVGIVSKATGKVGTVAVPVRVPNLTDDRLQMPTVILGREGAGEPAMPAAALAGLVPFQPTLARTFSQDDTLRIFAPLYWAAHDEAVAVTLTVTGPGAELSRTFTVPAQEGLAGPRHGTADQTAPLADLDPGDHVLTLTATLAGGKPVVRTIGFRVIPR